MSAGMRFSQAMRGVHALWREEAPRCILSSLMGAAWGLLHNGAPAILTLYIIDPWLQGVMAGKGTGDDIIDDSEKIKLQPWKPTLLYLQGKVTIHAYQRQAGRVEPPRFTDLDQLPIRMVGQLALPLQIEGRPPSAVIQVVVPRRSDSPGRPPVGRPRMQDEHEGPKETVTEHITDAQISGLQLLCGTAANIIEMRSQTSAERAIRMRAEDCLAVTAELSSVPRLTDFEQMVKVHLKRFFNVGFVRLCFWDNSTRMLVTAPDRPYCAGGVVHGDQRDDSSKNAVVGRRQLMHVSLEDGIVGKCTKKLQVFHVERIIMSADASERADGVNMSGHSAHLNMLAGPMVAHLNEKMLLIGTLQLVEKKPHNDAGSAGMKTKPSTGAHQSHRNASRVEPFSEEDQTFFSSMLKILGLAAYRTMQLQVRSEAGEVEIDIEKLLS